VKLFSPALLVFSTHEETVFAAFTSGELDGSFIRTTSYSVNRAAATLSMDAESRSRVVEGWSSCRRIGRKVNGLAAPAKHYPRSNPRDVKIDLQQ
jgi:hypothetical protein